MTRPKHPHVTSVYGKGYRLAPSWSLTWTLVVAAFALGYAWHFAQVETHPEIYYTERLP